METEEQELERLKDELDRCEQVKKRNAEASRRSFEDWSSNAIPKVGRAFGHHITVPKSKLRKLWEFLFY